MDTCPAKNACSNNSLQQIDMREDAVGFVPTHLCICCIDDSAVARKLLASNMEFHMPGNQVLQFGETLASVEEFKAQVWSSPCATSKLRGQHFFPSS